MGRYAIINTVTRLVENVVDYEAAPGNPPPGFGESYIAVQSDLANPGWGYVDGSFVPPEEPPAPATPVSYTPLEFMARFTDAEQTAISAAALANPAINLWLMKAMGAREILPSDPRTIAGMQDLVDAELITAERRDAILG